MVRNAIGVIAAVVVLSVGLVLIKPPQAAPRSVGAVLSGVEIKLYPERDPNAYWVFAADTLEQDPSSRESTVRTLQKGERYVGNKLDLRLSAPSVVIDANDNIRAPYATAEILDNCMRVELGAAGMVPVVIDQQTGFIAPKVSIISPELKGEALDFRSDFKIEDIQTGQNSFEIRSGTEQLPCNIKDARL